MDLHQRAGRPDHWADIESGLVDDDLAEFSDAYDLAHEIEFEDDHQDDEAGIYADSYPGPSHAYDPDRAWHDQMQLTEAIDRIWAEYEALLAPYRDAMKRNPGVKPAAMSRLEQARDAEIREVTRSYQKAGAMQWAAREAPQRAAQAAERRASQVALNTLGRDLGRGSRRSQVDEYHGRATTDIAIW